LVLDDLGIAVFVIVEGPFPGVVLLFPLVQFVLPLLDLIGFPLEGFFLLPDPPVELVQLMPSLPDLLLTSDFA